MSEGRIHDDADIADISKPLWLARCGAQIQHDQARIVCVEPDLEVD